MLKILLLALSASGASFALFAAMSGLPGEAGVGLFPLALLVSATAPLLLNVSLLLMFAYGISRDWRRWLWLAPPALYLASFAAATAEDRSHVAALVAHNVANLSVQNPRDLSEAEVFVAREDGANSAFARVLATTYEVGRGADPKGTFYSLSLSDCRSLVRSLKGTLDPYLEALDPTDREPRRGPYWGTTAKLSASVTVNYGSSGYCYAMVARSASQPHRLPTRQSVVIEIVGETTDERGFSRPRLISAKIPGLSPISVYAGFYEPLAKLPSVTVVRGRNGGVAFGFARDGSQWIGPSSAKPGNLEEAAAVLLGLKRPDPSAGRLTWTPEEAAAVLSLARREMGLSGKG